MTVHAAARLGMIDRLRQLVAQDPAVVSARGGDGQTPLHFASTIEMPNSCLLMGPALMRGTSIMSPLQPNT